MKTLWHVTIFLISFSLLAKVSHAASRLISQNDSTLLKLEEKKAAVDVYLKKNEKALIILAKVPGKKTLIRVKNEKWPDEIEYTYNTLKDAKGKIAMISQIPYSESGDWFITYTHYFDEDGKAYAFRKETNVFDNDVKGGVIFETLLIYYDPYFKVMKRFYTLKDKSGKNIKNNRHVDIYRYKYTVFKNATDCLKAYNITSMP